MNQAVYDDLVKQAMSGGKEKGLDNVFKYIDDYINKNPNTLEAYIVRSEFFSAIEAFEEALDDAEKAIKINPKDTAVYNNRGSIYVSSGNDINKAFNDFNKAIELDANNISAYTNRANMYLKMKEPQRAINDCTKAIELMAGDNEEDFTPYYNRGLAYANLGEIEKAFEDYNKVIELVPENAEAYAKRGFINSQLGNTQEAIQDYEKFLQLDPDNKNAKLTRDELEKLKSERGSSTGNSGRTRKLIRMAVGLGIGGVIGILLSVVGSGYWYVGLLIGAYLGIGIDPFGDHFKEEVGQAWYFTKRAFSMAFNKDGYGAVANFILIMWPLAKLCFWFVICPFIAIYQLVTSK